MVNDETSPYRSPITNRHVPGLKNPSSIGQAPRLRTGLHALTTGIRVTEACKARSITTVRTRRCRARQHTRRCAYIHLFRISLILTYVFECITYMCDLFGPYSTAWRSTVYVGKDDFSLPLVNLSKYGVTSPLVLQLPVKYPVVGSGTWSTGLKLLEEF